MFGRPHLLLSVVSVSLVLTPIFPIYPNAVILAITGTTVGSFLLMQLAKVLPRSTRSDTEGPGQAGSAERS